jgi:hypothetical protein
MYDALLPTKYEYTGNIYMINRQSHTFSSNLGNNCKRNFKKSTSIIVMEQYYIITVIDKSIPVIVNAILKSRTRLRLVQLFLKICLAQLFPKLAGLECV